eukprot:27714-Eustigmatos_ZCMA.PRE.1
MIEARLESLLSAARSSGTGAHNERREGSAPKKPQTGYTFWSSDFHISPIADLKDLLEPMGMHIIDKSLSGHCHLKKTCAKDLKVPLQTSADGGFVRYHRLTLETSGDTL